MCYVKSPLNYTGGKYKLLPQILPLFPEKIDTFWDMFGGGFNVGINVKANRIVYNDIIVEIAEMLHWFKEIDIDKLLNEIDGTIKNFGLGKYNKEGYLDLREEYNKHKNNKKLNFKSSIELYTLICHSFSNQIRFNKNREFNMPFGKNRSSFNPTLRKRFIQFIAELHKKKVMFYCTDFTSYIQVVHKDDLVYCDPPYLNSTATYNEQNKWKDEDEFRLLKWLDKLDDKGVRFALSNNLKYENPYLKQWIEENKGKYKVHYLKTDYSNCNYQKKDKSKDCEVLVVNY